MKSHIKTLTDFLRAHGAGEISTTHTNGGHIRISYVWAGELKHYVTAASPSDYRAVKNDLSDLRREIGREPIVQPLKVKRSLDDMVSAITLPLTEAVMDTVALKAPVAPETVMKKPDVTGVGFVALTDAHTAPGSKSLRLQVPEYVFRAVGDPPGVVITRVDDNTWRISGTDAKDSLTPHKRAEIRQGYVAVESRERTLYSGLGIWGSTAGECIVVDNDILISIDLTHLKSVRKRQLKPKSVVQSVFTKDYVITDPPIRMATEAPLNVPTAMPGKEDIKRALLVIQQVQETMPHLKLVRRPTGAYEFKFDLGC